MQADKAQMAWYYDFVGWFDTHKKQTVQVAAVVAVFALIVSYYFYSQTRKEEAAAAQFAHLMFTRATPEQLLKFQAENRGSQAAPKALLLAAQELFAAGQYPEAQAQFQKLRQEYRNSPFTGIASLGVAASLDAQGKTDEAISAYTDIAQRRESDVQTIQAQFALGRLYETKGQLDKAVDCYDAIVQAGGNTDFANESYMRAGELRALHPNLVKPGAAAVPAMMSGK